MSAARLSSLASHSVSKRPIWLVEAASRLMALPPTIQRIVGSRPSRSASLMSSYPASRLNTDLAQHAFQIVATVPTRAAINQVLARDNHQTQRVIEFAIGQQAGIGGDARTVELQLEATVETGPQGIGLRFTRRLNHLRPRSNETRR